MLEGLHLRRDRRRPAAGDRGRRQELAQGRSVPRRAAVDLRVGRVRVAARRQHGVRRAQQLAARRLQAVPRQEHRSRPDVHEHHRQPAGSPRRLVGDPGSRQRQPAVRRHRVRRVHERGRRAALGAAQGRHAGRAGARHDGAEAREAISWSATFGRGFYVLDDYSPLRELAAQALSEEAHLYPLRDAYIYSQTGMAPAGTAGIGPMSGNWSAPNPPYGAVFTYSVKRQSSVTTSWC